MTGQEHNAPVTDDDPKVEHSDDPDEIRAQIEETRHELGETVEALAAKADVKAQVKDKAEATKETVQQQARQRPGAFIGAGVAMLVALVARRRIKARRKKK
jgi:hypothetical protein